jgi:acyl-CoA reductase-like NAD-dependent aldehyde dehydrogenase
MKAAAESNLKRVSLELGGKSPLVMSNGLFARKRIFVSYETKIVHSAQLEKLQIGLCDTAFVFRVN